MLRGLLNRKGKRDDESSASAGGSAGATEGESKRKHKTIKDRKEKTQELAQQRQRAALCLTSFRDMSKRISDSLLMGDCDATLFNTLLEIISDSSFHTSGDQVQEAADLFLHCWTTTLEYLHLSKKKPRALYQLLLRLTLRREFSMASGDASLKSMFNDGTSISDKEEDVFEEYMVRFYDTVHHIRRELLKKHEPSSDEIHFYLEALAIGTFLIPGLLDLLRKGIEQHNKKDGAIEALLDDMQRNQHRAVSRKSSKNLRGQLSVIRQAKAVEMVTRRERIKIQREKLLSEDDTWTTRLFRQKDIYYAFLQKWTSEVSRILRMRLEDVDWNCIPGYFDIIRQFLMDSKTIRPVEFSILFKACSKILLYNPYMIGCYLSCILPHTDVHDRQSVLTVLNLLKEWFSFVSYVPKDLDLSILLQAFRILLDSMHHEVLIYTLGVLYEFDYIWRGAQRMELFHKILLEDHFYKFFLHWDHLVRVCYMKLFLYKISAARNGRLDATIQDRFQQLVATVKEEVSAMAAEQPELLAAAKKNADVAKKARELANKSGFALPPPSSDADDDPAAGDDDSLGMLLDAMEELDGYSSGDSDSEDDLSDTEEATVTTTESVDLSTSDCKTDCIPDECVVYVPYAFTSFESERRKYDQWESAPKFDKKTKKIIFPKLAPPPKHLDESNLDKLGVPNCDRPEPVLRRDKKLMFLPLPLLNPAVHPASPRTADAVVNTAGSSSLGSVSGPTGTPRTRRFFNMHKSRAGATYKDYRDVAVSDIKEYFSTRYNGDVVYGAAVVEPPLSPRSSEKARLSAATHEAVAELSSSDPALSSTASSTASSASAVSSSQSSLVEHTAPTSLLSTSAYSPLKSVSSPAVCLEPLSASPSHSRQRSSGGPSSARAPRTPDKKHDRRSARKSHDRDREREKKSTLSSAAPASPPSSPSARKSDSPTGVASSVVLSREDSPSAALNRPTASVSSTTKKRTSSTDPAATSSSSSRSVEDVSTALASASASASASSSSSTSSPKSSKHASSSGSPSSRRVLGVPASPSSHSSRSSKSSKSPKRTSTMESHSHSRSKSSPMSKKNKSALDLPVDIL